MFFDSTEEVKNIAKKTHTSIFVIPDSEEVQIKNALFLKPEEKTVITIEQVREMIVKLNTKQTEDRFVIIRPADKLGGDAVSAFLKTLEEPKAMIHFLLITENPSRLPQTILSRASIYFLKTKFDLKTTKIEDEKIKNLAKKLMTAKNDELLTVADEITKKKDGVREYSLNIVGAAIEMLYKSYFLTEKEIFLKKLPIFLKLYENIYRNGHIKLHLVADLC